MEKLAQFSELVTLPNQWPPEVQRRTKWDDYISDIAGSLSMDARFIMSEDELSDKSNKEREGALEDTAIAEASKAIPEVIKGQMAEGG